jgi:hypothetical protein
MRDQAFYWKCDSPGSAQQKKGTYFSDEHTPEREATAREIVQAFLGRAADGFESSLPKTPSG